MRREGAKADVSGLQLSSDLTPPHTAHPPLPNKQTQEETWLADDSADDESESADN